MAALRGPEFQAGRPRPERADKNIGTAGFEYASELIGGEW